MNIIIGILTKVIMMFFKGDIDVEVKKTATLHHGNPNTRKRLSDFIRMHYRNKGVDSSAIDAIGDKEDS